MALRSLVGMPIWLVSQVIPPSLLTYFYLAWKRCTYEVTPYVGQTYGSAAGRIYQVATSALLLPTSLLFLRLYFLPRNQSLPPRDPSDAVRNRQTIFECLPPEEIKLLRLAAQKAGVTSATDHELDDEVVVNRCYRGRCHGRWKPARARHCSECGVCRAGFDHHCAFFANCLTTPYIPTFLLTLLLAPISVIGLCLPVFRPFTKRFMEAFRMSRSDEQFKWWWDWWLSWIVAGGPIGRYGGAVALAWREMDRRDGATLFRLSTGIMIVIGFFLTMIAGGLAYTTINLVRSGQLTIDRERSRAHSRTLHAIAKLEAANQPIPEQLSAALNRFADIRHFYVPVPDHEHAGEVVPTLPGENPYDFGATDNWRSIMGPGWGWLLPWQALTRGMGDEILNWPIAPTVEARLKAEATRRFDARIDTSN